MVIAALSGSVTVVNAQVVAYRHAPGNQQPTVLRTGNGIPLVNIQTPSAQGVSRNVYSQFDVDSKGVILNNRNGAMRAHGELSITGTGAIDNSQGLLSAGQTLDVHDKHVAGTPKKQTLTNTDGKLIAGQRLSIDSAAMTGAGQTLSQGDLSLKLDADYHNTGTTQANGNASITSAGKLVNNGQLLAGKTLAGTATSIDNQANGQIIAQSNVLRAIDSHTVSNRGLIDGTYVWSTKTVASS